MRNLNKWLPMALLVVLFITFGYLRDFIFINLNYHLYHIQNETATSDAHSFFEFLNNYSFWQLYSAKYVLTGCFALANFFLGFAFLKILFGKSRLTRWYIWIYLSVLGVAGMFFAGGYIFGNPDGGYYFSRILMGFLQSPVPTGVLALGYPLYLQSQSS